MQALIDVIYGIILFSMYFVFPAFMAYILISDRKLTSVPFQVTFLNVGFAVINIALMVSGIWLATTFFRGFTPPGFSGMNSDGLGTSLKDTLPALSYNIASFKSYISYLDSTLFSWVTNKGNEPSALAEYFQSLSLVLKFFAIFVVGSFLFALAAMVVNALYAMTNKMRGNDNYGADTYDLKYEIELLWLLPFLSVYYLFEVTLFALIGPALMLLIIPSFVVLAVGAVQVAIMLVVFCFFAVCLSWYMRTNYEVNGRYW